MMRAVEKATDRGERKVGKGNQRTRDEEQEGGAYELTRECVYELGRLQRSV